ncbi:MAG TPA: LLM class flavin-dependent oxidoreductase [Trebonia sp.]|jgi:alkanesulfonate monooxygenase SsuD/methylene tetrahydromethanopterin reductase-like flavin-dependent oxidoreductase (luciferase family)
MTAITRADSLRSAGHPVYSDRKLRLGTFSTNVNGGCTATTIDGVLTGDWASTSELARLADGMDFEALVPVGRWRGFGGKTDFNGTGFESFTWAAGIGAQTSTSGVFATTHVPTMHPVLVAKQAATIDHITGGRFALNVVTGWNTPEIEMFGAPMLEHDLRYESAAEWLDIIKRLWTSEERFSYEGRFHQVKEASISPLPLQDPYPVIMNAGGSRAGQHFGAKHCDVVFITPGGIETPGPMAEKVAEFKRLAREEYGRELLVWTLAYIVPGDTEQDAKDYYDLYVNQKGDWEAIDNLVGTLGMNSQSVPADVLAATKRHFVAGWGGYPLIGTSEMVVDKLSALVDTGLDGVLLSWPRFVQDMTRFKAETYPLLKEAGLR